MALSHNPFIFFSIVTVFVFFFIIAIFAIIKKSKGATGILKFAPSVLTSLGLLGTFLALTTSLVSLQTNESGNISSESLSGFIKSLESVFSFSIMGIGAAIIFMAINFSIVAYRNKQIFNQRNVERQDALQRQKKLQEVNSSTLEELKNHSYLLSGLRHIDNKTDEQNQYLKGMHDILRQEDNSQQEAFDSINDSMRQIALAIDTIQSGYDMNKLGSIVSKSVGDVLLEPLDKMAKSMEKNSSEIISDVLKDLKEEILIPIKNEIASTTASTNNVVEALGKSQETNLKLITELGKVTVQMDSFVNSMTDIVKAMSGTVDALKEMQKEQDESLTKFNEDLQTSLSGIQPAIKQGMKEAETSLTLAIKTATDSMNDSMTGVIQQISDDVVGGLGHVLSDFKDDMNGYLSRMNNQLEDFVTKNKNVVDTLATTVEGMHDLQTKQEESLYEFNSGLKDNLSQIQPAIESGMKEAETSLTLAIKTATDSMNDSMTGVIQQISDDVVGGLGHVLSDFKDDMNGYLSRMNNQLEDFVTKNKNVVDTLATTVEGMHDLQTKQEESLYEFNSGLKDNLSQIQPAIESGMKEAETSLTLAIDTVTNKMNTAMTGVIQKISDDVVENLGEVLRQFDNNMDVHLDRMNEELEQTGQRASSLIDGSASALKDTLGQIDKTLGGASAKLTSELEAFRKQYQFSLTEFFEQQNQALEQTLGVQSKRLQSTADQLGEQFNTMRGAQEKLNNGFKETIDSSKRVYEPLLNQMATIATTLNNGQKHLSSEIHEVVADIQEINNALKDLGSTLPKEFATAFESLNDAYITASNNNNDILQKMMNEMITASAALLTASNSQLQDA